MSDDTTTTITQLRIHYNLVANRASVDLTPQEEEWEEFVASWEAPSVRVAKDGPAFVPARFKPDGKRRKEDGLTHTLLVLDLDNKGNTLSKARIQQILQGWLYAAHTTHSSRGDHPKWRVVLPLEHDVDHETYVEIYDYFSDLFGDEMDSSCFDIPRLFYLPATPDPDFYETWNADGKLFSPKDIKVKRDVPVLPKNRRITTKNNATDESLPVTLDVLPKGQIDNILVSIAGLTWGFGCGLEEIEAMLKVMAKRAEVPVSDNHIRDVLKTIQRYTRGQHSLKIYDFNVQHAIVDLRGKTRILTEAINPEYGYSDFYFGTVMDFISRYAYRKDDVTNWLHSKFARRYRGVVFDPSETSGDEYYNSWRGFAVEPVEGDCGLYLAHAKEVICNGNETLYTWLITWMAAVVQKPAELAGTSVVFRGGQGTGKSLFCELFGRLFGQHFVQISQQKHIVGNFNSLIAQKVLVLAEEAFYAGDHKVEGPLKALITEKALSFEQKGIDPIQIRNCLHVMFCSNHDWVVPAGELERRFAVFDVSPVHQQDKPYFKRLINQMENGGLEALMHFLQNWDLRQGDPRTIPMTEALAEQKGFSLGAEFIFFIDWLSHVQPNVPYMKKEIYEDYKSKNARPLNSIHLFRLFHKYIQHKVHFKEARKTGGGDRYYVFPTNERGMKTIEETRESVANQFHPGMTWSELLKICELESDEVEGKDEHKDKPY